MSLNAFIEGIRFLDELSQEIDKLEKMKFNEEIEKTKSEVNSKPETKTEPNPEPELEDEFDTDTKIDESELFNEYRIKKIIDHIIFYNPNTVVFFKDGSVISVKSAPNETYDPEKGLAMAILKYIFGNKYFRDMTAVINKSEVIMEPKRHKNNKTENIDVKPVKKTTKSTSTKAKVVKKTTTKKTTSSN